MPETSLARLRKSDDPAFPNAYGMRSWLLSNLDVLGDSIGFRLLGAVVEGDEAALIEGENSQLWSLVAEVSQGSVAGLGAALSSWAATGVSGAIWVAQRFSSDHLMTAHRLNIGSAIPLFLVKMEKLILGNSMEGVSLTAVAWPSSDPQVEEIRSKYRHRRAARARWWGRLAAVRSSKLETTGIDLSSATAIFRRFSRGSLGYLVSDYNSVVEARITIEYGQETYLETLKSELKAALPGRALSINSRGEQVIVSVHEAGGFLTAESDWEQTQTRLVSAMRTLRRVARQLE